jgi:hypothetical protein
MMYLSANIHMDRESEPTFYRLNRDAENSSATRFAFSRDGVSPEIVLFAQTETQRRWLDTVLAASDEFWRQEDESIQIAAE